MLGVNFDEKTGNKLIAAKAFEMQGTAIRKAVFKGDISKASIRELVAKSKQYADELLEHLDEEEPK